MMNKRGLFGLDNTLTVVLGVIVMVVLLAIMGSILGLFSSSSPDKVCAASAVTSSAASIGGKNILTFSCPRRYWGFGPSVIYEYEEGKISDKKVVKRAGKSLEWSKTIDDAAVSGSTKEEVLENVVDILTGGQDDTTAKQYSIEERKQLSERLLELQKKEDIRTYDQQDFMNGFIAERMFNCVEKLGGGSFSLFDHWYGKLPKTRNFCVICDGFDFKELHKESSKLGVQDVSAINTVTTLDEWMSLWTIPKKDLTYYAYVRDVNLQKQTMWQTQFDYNTNRDEFVIIYTEAVDNVALDLAQKAGKVITWPVRAVSADSNTIKATKARAVLFVEKSFIPDVCDYVVN